MYILVTRAFVSVRKFLSEIVEIPVVYVIFSPFTPFNVIWLIYGF